MEDPTGTPRFSGAFTVGSEAPRWTARPPRLSELTRDTLRDYFEYAWNLYEWLFSGLEPSKRAYGTSPHPFRNSMAFYYGHTAAFYIQKLQMVGAVSGSSAPSLDVALARGVSPRTAEELKPDGIPPEVSQLRDYRRELRDRIMRTIDSVALFREGTLTRVAWALLMSIEHELIHFQTSIPLIRQLPLEYVERPQGWRYAPASEQSPNKEPSWVALPGDEIMLGRDPGHADRFGWDNEFGQVAHTVAEFEIAREPVTNRQYLEFVRDGGYQRPELWTSAGARTWLETMRPSGPAAWTGDPATQPGYRGVFDEMAMPWAWPVELNRHEAVAFATWSGHRLPTEPEFHHALDHAYGGAAVVRQNMERFNCDMRYGSPSPSGYMAETPDAPGIDLIGSVARWLGEDFYPLDPDSFSPDPLYEDFSKPWFGADHGLLLGVGFASCGHMAEVGLMRDFMQNHMDQVAGITLVK